MTATSPSAVVKQVRNDDSGRRFGIFEAATHHRTITKQWVEFLGEHPDRATERVEMTDIEAA